MEQKGRFEKVQLYLYNLSLFRYEISSLAFVLDYRIERSV